MRLNLWLVALSVLLVQFGALAGGDDVKRGSGDTLGKVAVGSKFMINADKVDGIGQVFYRRPKVYADSLTDPYKGGQTKASARVLTKIKKGIDTATGESATAVDCEWVKKLVLYDVNTVKAALKGGETMYEALQGNQTYEWGISLRVAAQGEDGSKSDSVAGAVYLIPPTITHVEYSGVLEAGTEITVEGCFFGSKAPKVMIEYKKGDAVKYKKCKVLKSSYGYVDAQGKSGKSVMDVESGESSVVIAYPKLNATTDEATGFLVVDNGIGIAVTRVTNTAWPMFHGNAQHTGQSPYSGPKTATLKWKYSVDTASSITRQFSGELYSSMVVDSEGNIYTTTDQKLLAMNSSGQVLWEAVVEGVGVPALAPDGKTLYTAGRTKLYAFTLDGELIWTFSEASKPIFGEPCVAGDGTIYCGSWDTYIYAVNPDGSLKWSFATDGSIAPLASPTLSPDDSTLYVGSGDPNQIEGGTLYALDSSSGSEKWSVKVDERRVSGPVVGPDGRIYVNGMRKVLCFDADGNKIWETEEGVASNLTGSLGADGTFYIGDQEGQVSALDTLTGEVKWVFQTGANPDYNPADPKAPQYGILAAIVIGADGTVYAGAIDGVMYAINPDGSELWRYDTGQSINENCPAIGPDGTLYFSSENNYLYAIQD